MKSIASNSYENTQKLMLRRSKTQNNYEYQSQEPDLERLARSNLCELSDNICDDLISQTKKPFFKKGDNFAFSPWKPKNKDGNHENELPKHQNSKNVKGERHLTSVKNNTLYKLSSDQKQNERPISKYFQQEHDIKKYPTIFSRLKAAKQLRYEPRQELQSTKVTAFFENGKQNIRNGQQENKFRPEKPEQSTLIVKTYNKKLQDLQILKKRSLNCIKSITCCFIELPGEVSEKQNRKSIKSTTDHWKARNLSLKRKKSRKSNKLEDSKSIQRKQSKENASSILNKTNKFLYQSNNPLTRLLYQKYMNTINICRATKEQKFDFL